MAKETQKAKIERLEKELWDAKVLNSKLQQEILVFQENAEIEFLNSPSFTQMQRTISQLKQEKQILDVNLKVTKDANTALRNEIQKLKSEIVIQIPIPIKNERGAGRKSLFTDEDKSNILMYRAEGKTIKELSELYCCSVGLIHKIINEKV